jgi:indolepyruvate ferredoxin oxidoreductase
MTTDAQIAAADAPVWRLAAVTLADKYDLSRNQILASGTQAIVRLLLMQKARDRQAGLNTAGFVSGYRGSPLGGLDLQLLRSREHLAASDIVFQPGLNEELAATAVWGSQQAEMRGEGKYDGVFSIWYGKGPGVDRCGDVFRHANLAGTSKNGGVVALMGDDHTAESSTTAHQSEFTFVDVMMPILSPAGVQEIIDFGLLGWAMSRFTGTWVGLKCLKDTVESTATIDGSLDRVSAVPPDFQMPAGGLNIRPRDGILDQEARLQDYKRDAMLAWLRVNRLNRIITSGGPQARVGVITVGKSYLDVRQALDDLGVDAIKANDLGLRLYKIGCPWPLEPGGLIEFVKGLELVIVVEEKRSLIEVQVREELYGTANQPRCIGKRDERGDWLFPVKGALDPNDIAIAIGERLLRFHPDVEIERRVERLKQVQAALAAMTDVAQRVPYFCSGCPHNSSTIVPHGSRAYAGIGCHFMVQWMDRSTEGFTQMGGEGANWVGEAPFSLRPHIFQNLGDGTYNHSGALAVRWAIDSGVNMTYKVLFNDAVAMTGGQRHEGGLTVPQIARQVAADGAKKIAVVSDEPHKYPADAGWPTMVTIHHRRELANVQQALIQVPGTTVLIYDQTCAAEKRRRRKRGAMIEPDQRVIINELVCEGCGDCGQQSNCVSIQPVETEYGRKRTIDQSSCNKDFSCANGFCPSFVTVRGARLKKAPSPPGGDGAISEAPIAEPDRREIGEKPYSIIVTGVGGTGVVTVAAILAMAAHLEGKGCGTIDMAGLAQKGGAVYSHVKLGRRPEDIRAIRVAAGDADLILGCDLVVSASKKVLAAVRAGATAVVINSAETYPGDFARNIDFYLPSERIKQAIKQASADTARFVDAGGIAAAMLGTTVSANMFMLGYAYQLGYVPLSAAAIERAIELNGEAVPTNHSAFKWGRRAAADLKSVETIVARLRQPVGERVMASSFEEAVDMRGKFLTFYQNRRLAKRYRKWVERVRTAETEMASGRVGLADAVARGLFKLMAVKDEYEVARLFSDGSFAQQLAATFEGQWQLEFHLAPPFLAKKDRVTGLPAKMTFGPWMMTVFRLLAAGRFLRGSFADPFRYAQERRVERQLIKDYEALIEELIRSLRPDNHPIAVALAEIPLKIRGFGHVKARHLAAAKAEEAELLERFRANPPSLRAAAE